MLVQKACAVCVLIEDVYKRQAEDILILERDGRLGGILNQCIHNGFGLHTFKEDVYKRQGQDCYKSGQISGRLSKAYRLYL